MVDPALNRYTFVITYMKDEVTLQYTGTFSGRNSAVAMENAKDFVIKYLRPSSIVGAAFAP